MERRIFPLDHCDLRQASESRPPQFVGHAAVFNQLSDDLGGFRERLAPGAFAETLGGDVRFLQNHNADLLLGRTTSGTLRLSEDELGLAVEGDLPDTSYARDLQVLLKRGDLSQMSFGFETLDDEWETQDGEAIRTLKRVELWDVSAVTFPAYPQTTAEVRAKAARVRAEAARVRAEREERTVVPYQDFPLADRERAWDKSGADGRVREQTGASEGPTPAYAKCFLWYDGGGSDADGDGVPDQFGSYKLLICDVVEGKLVAVPKAIFAVAAVLQGARGGTDIPEAEQARIKANVARYYAKMRDAFGDDSIVAPWERSLLLSGETREGKMLSGANYDIIAQAVELLQSLLAAAADADDQGPKQYGRTPTEQRAAEDADPAVCVSLLTEMIELGSSFIAEEDDPEDVASMRAVLDIVLRLLSTELAEPGDEEEDAAARSAHVGRAPERRGWQDIDVSSVWRLTYMIELGAFFIRDEDDADDIAAMREALVMLQQLLAGELMESGQADGEANQNEQRASRFDLERRRIRLLELT